MAMRRMARSRAARSACLLHPIDHAKGVLLVRGAAHPDGCGEVSVIVSAEPARGLCPQPWPALVDRFTVWRYGATAVWLNGDHATLLTDRAWRGTGRGCHHRRRRTPTTAPTLPPALTDTEALTE